MKLSIITINRNNADGLRRTLESTLGAQPGFDDWEQIVVDGASTDGGFAVIDKWKEDSHLGWHVSEPDTGIYNAMNKGAVHAKGDYLLFLNSGDELLPDILAKVFSSCIDADILFGDQIVRYNSGSEWLWEMNTEAVSPPQFLVQSMPHQATFVSHALHDRMKGYDESFKIAGDYKFFFKCSCDPLVSWRRIPFAVCVFDASGMSNSTKYLATIAKELESVLSPVFGNFIAARAATLWCRNKIAIVDARRCLATSVMEAARTDARLARLIYRITRVVTFLWRFALPRFIIHYGSELGAWAGRMIRRLRANNPHK